MTVTLCPACGQVAGQLVMTRPAGFIEGGKGLVDQKNMHYFCSGRITGCSGQPPGHGRHDQFGHFVRQDRQVEQIRNGHPDRLVRAFFRLRVVHFLAGPGSECPANSFDQIIILRSALPAYPPATSG